MWTVAPAPPAAALQGAPSPGSAKGALVIPYTAISAIMAPLWVAVEKHLFSPYGLEVTTQAVANGAVATAAMLGGSYRMIMNDGPSTISAAAGGSDVVMVTTLSDRVNQAIMTRPEITSAAQLRDKTIGVTTLGTLSGFAAQLFLERSGIRLSDVRIVQLQTQPAMAAALTSGRLDAAPFSHPLLIEMRNAGMHELAEMWTMDVPFMATGLETTHAYLNGHRDTVRAAIEGLIAGTAYLRTHPQEAMDVIRKYTRVEDRAALQETWTAYAHRLFLPKPYPSVAGAYTVLRLLSGTNPAVKSLTPDRVLDASLVRELDQSGEIDRIVARVSQ